MSGDDVKKQTKYTQNQILKSDTGTACFRAILACFGALPLEIGFAKHFAKIFFGKLLGVKPLQIKGF